VLFASTNALRADDMPVQLPAGALMSYLDNGRVKVGVDLSRGGAIVFLAHAGEGNLINNFDLGRQVQLSFFSGPVPFRANGQSPKKHWEHLGWNPIQAGDDFENSSRVLAPRLCHLRTQSLEKKVRNGWLDRSPEKRIDV
jgi:hypothetical protein